MSKNLIFIFHGMGVHTEETTKKDFINPIEEYSEFYGIKLKKDWKKDVEFILYDFHFKEILDDWKKDLNNLGKILPLGSGVNFIEDLLPKLGSIEENLSEENREFFITHFGDVILYKFFRDIRSMIINNVSEKVLKKIISIIQNGKRSGTEIHFIAHSLGTAVAADTLNYYYDVLIDELKEVPNFPLIDSLHMFGNVSHLINGSPLNPSESPIYNTYCRPCSGTRFYYNYRHIFDPFTLEPIKFQPDKWLENYRDHYDEFDLKRFTLPVILNKNPKEIQDISKEILNLNSETLKKLGHTHSFAHYISDPNVLFYLIYELGIVDMTKEKFKKSWRESDDKFKKISFDIFDKKELGAKINKIKNSELDKILKLPQILFEKED